MAELLVTVELVFAGNNELFTMLDSSPSVSLHSSVQAATSAGRSVTYSTLILMFCLYVAVLRQ